MQLNTDNFSRLPGIIMNFKQLTSSLSLAALLLCLLLSGCADSKKPTSNTNGTPEAQFDTLFHDFGSVHQGERVVYSFTIRNQGTANLLIQDVIASCGCTVVQYPSAPIAPDEAADIQVEFDTAGRKGMQYKHILVKTNSPKKQTTLSIKANVVIQ